MSLSYPQELPSQLFFESLINGPAPAPLVIVYFTARWCGACKRVDIPRLMGLRPEAVWYSCDVDDNTYTPGYCGLRTIPAFQAIANGKALPLLSSSNTDVIAAWLDAIEVAPVE
jgi:hypothetical protein